MKLKIVLIILIILIISCKKDVPQAASNLPSFVEELTPIVKDCNCVIEDNVRIECICPGQAENVDIFIACSSPPNNLWELIENCKAGKINNPQVV